MNSEKIVRVDLESAYDNEDAKYFIRLLPRVEDILPIEYGYENSNKYNSPTFVNKIDNSFVVVGTREPADGYQCTFTADEIQQMVDDEQIIPEMFLIIAEEDIADFELYLSDEYEQDEYGTEEGEKCRCSCERCGCEEVFCDCYDDAYATEDVETEAGAKEN